MIEAQDDLKSLKEQAYQDLRMRNYKGVIDACEKALVVERNKPLKNRDAKFYTLLGLAYMDTDARKARYYFTISQAIQRLQYNILGTVDTIYLRALIDDEKSKKSGKDTLLCEALPEQT